LFIAIAIAIVISDAVVVVFTILINHNDVQNKTKSNQRKAINKREEKKKKQ